MKVKMSYSFTAGRQTIDLYQCSECGTLSPALHHTKYRYCPYCGKAIDWNEEGGVSNEEKRHNQAACQDSL